MRWERIALRSWAGYGNSPRSRLTDRPLRVRMVDVADRFYDCRPVVMGIPRTCVSGLTTVGELGELCDWMGCHPCELIDFEPLR